MKIRSLVIRPGGCFPTPPSRNDIRDPRYLVALITGRYVTQANAREKRCYSRTRNADDDENDETAVRVGDRAIQLSLSLALSQRVDIHARTRGPIGLHRAGYGGLFVVAPSSDTRRQT